MPSVFSTIRQDSLACRTTFGGGLLNGDTQKAVMGSIPRDRAGMASGISTTARFSGILLGFATLSAVLATFAATTRTAGVCAVAARACAPALRFANLVFAGDEAGAVALLPSALAAQALQLAHRGYAAGFAAALLVAVLLVAVLLVAALIGAIGCLLVAALMRPAASRVVAPTRPAAEVSHPIAQIVELHK
jgi:hypothetical protein